MPSIAIPVSLRGQLLSGARPTLTNILFSANEPGFTFEPWDITTLYQDRAGTTPVTAAGQSVGLRLDKSQGLVLGSELRTATVVVSGAWTQAGGVVTAPGTNGAIDNVSYTLSAATVAGRFYEVAIPNTMPGGSFYVDFGSGTGSQVGALGSSTQRIILTCTASGSVIRVGRWTGSPTGTIGPISVRELAGNHQVAVSDAKRGVYGWMPKTGRRNQLNATDTLSTQSVTVTAVAHTLAFTGTGTVTLSGVSTAGPLVGTGAGNRVTLTFTPTAGSLTLTVSGSVTLAQLEIGSSATAYQRVVSQYDVTEAGVPTCYYVQADGVDDAYVTPTITPNTDKAQVFAGVRKLSDAAQGALIELSASPSGNNGTITVNAPGDPTTARYNVFARLSSASEFAGVESFPAPINNVVSALFDCSKTTVGGLFTVRVDGTQRTLVNKSADPVAPQSILAYPAYIYSRGGTSFPFNGLDFGHAVRFGPNLDAATIARVESLIARNTPEVTL